MTAPSKPWEGAGPNLRSSAAFPNSGNPEGLGLYSSSSVPPMPGTVPVARRVVGAAPPIPARIGTVATRQMYGAPATGMYGAGYGMGSFGGGYGGSYGSSYGSSYGGYGGYGTGAYGTGGYGTGGYGTGGYGSFGSRGYGGYGMNQYPPRQQMSSLESRFIQMAEENSRPAFESIESLVHAFGSVSFMMESTFNAIYSSFRAVLGVAENFGRLRTLFGQVFQTFAILRAFQWMYRKLLYYLGVRRENPGGEAIWQQATGQLDPKTRRTFWPVAMFLSLVCAGPFLVWRLLRSLNIAPPSTDTASDPRTWIDNNGMATFAVSLYDFTAAQENELSFRSKMGVWIAPAHLQPQSRDWLLATQDFVKTGLVPANYVKMLGQRRLARRETKPAVPSVPEVPSKLPANWETAEPVPELLVGHQVPLPTHTSQPPIIPVGSLSEQMPSLAGQLQQAQIHPQPTQGHQPAINVASSDCNQPAQVQNGVEEQAQHHIILDQFSQPQPSLNLPDAPSALTNEDKTTS